VSSKLQRSQIKIGRSTKLQTILTHQYLDVILMCPECIQHSRSRGR